MKDHLKIIEDLHRALQYIRPVVATIAQDNEVAPWLKTRAEIGLTKIDPAMVAADEAFPNHNFYQGNQ